MHNKHRKIENVLHASFFCVSPTNGEVNYNLDGYKKKKKSRHCAWDAKKKNKMWPCVFIKSRKRLSGKSVKRSCWCVVRFTWWHLCQGQHLLHHHKSRLITGTVFATLASSGLTTLGYLWARPCALFCNVQPQHLQEHLVFFHFLSIIHCSHTLFFLFSALQSTHPLTSFLYSFFLIPPLVLVFNNSSYALLPPSPPRE